MEGNQFDDVGVVEPQIDPKELKAQKKKKKQKYVLRKKEKRKYKTYEKNRKNQPSAVNQRHEL